MNPATETTKKTVRMLLPPAAALFVIALAVVLDGMALDTLDFPRASREDWHKLLRSMGSLYPWFFAAAAVWLLRRHDADPAARRGWLVVLISPVVAGIAAEALKLLLRRERPLENSAVYVFRALTDTPLSTSGLGLPSSHAAVAFGGAAALCWVAPRAWPVWLLLAAGCGLTRLLDRAHFLSDVTAGAVVGVVAAWGAARLLKAKAGLAPAGGGS